MHERVLWFGDKKPVIDEIVRKLDNFLAALKNTYQMGTNDKMRRWGEALLKLKGTGAPKIDKASTMTRVLCDQLYEAWSDLLSCTDDQVKRKAAELNGLSLKICKTKFDDPHNLDKAE